MKGGSFTNSSDFNVTGKGVRIYSDTGSITITGNGNLNITPLTSGIYEGFSLMLNRTSNGIIQISANGSSTNVGGTVYAANSFIDLSGNGSLNATQLVSRTLTLSANGTLNINWNSNSTAPTRSFGLVE
jgi:hypothetical protein